jgi:uncharacterized protein (DUF433 family)
MITAEKDGFRIGEGENAVATYTQEEALAIARRLALEKGGDILVYDGEGSLKARVFPHGDAAYVDYYLSERIAQCEIIVHGKPRIASGRIMVQSILDLLAEGVSIEDITGEEFFPDITREDVLACIAYASGVVQQSGIVSLS